MLLSFSIENFRSFRSEETFSLLASKRLGDMPGSFHTIAVPGMEERVLRVASCYGPNGAGKSNLVRALACLKKLVLSGTAPGGRLAYEPFLFDDGRLAAPTCFDLQFLAEGEVFRYGVVYDAKQIHEEWLSVYEGKKEREVFTRACDKSGEVVVELGDAGRGKCGSAKLSALAQVGSRPNQLFLTEVVNLDDKTAQGPHFHRAIEWFASTLSIIEANALFSQLAKAIATDETFAQFASHFLSAAGTGIKNIEVQTHELTRSDLPSVPADFWETLSNASNSVKCQVIYAKDGKEIFVEGASDDRIRLRDLLALHGSARLPFHEESDGTRRLLHLLPALHLLTTAGGVFVVDELERSMHPMLAWKFIEFFQKTAGRPDSQLIFTTHESTLLDQDLQRRDGIWFAEKDKVGATHLYSLADFKVRKDERIEKGYLQGRYGAIPFLGGIDYLMTEQQATAEGQA